MPNQVNVTVQYYAISRDITGTREEKLALPVHTNAKELFGKLIARHPGLKAIEKNCLLAFNGDLLTEDSGAIQLTLGDELAVIPPLSGTTRDNFNGKKVSHLEYEAYESMAVKEINKICDHVRSNWEVKRIAILHRLGHVPITEASVIIAVSSPHRKDSLEAVNYAIDTLKATVPIWKKEFYEEGGSSWKENKECCWSGEATSR